ncbi:UNVERIFIED_CONTAM: UDP-galactose/UDP-glucose transporter 7 [Sesamum radiatum]|uniref:UDP-galactose/UDP-glucose transporter 7 n=1 Tax=Sesamum radiatum TaxID=300843 RepID=A0AAW2INM9_SESRA
MELPQWRWCDHQQQGGCSLQYAHIDDSLTLQLDSLLEKGRPTTQVTMSVLLIAAGVLIAALGDFSFDLFGYTMAFTSVFFQTMYLVLVEKSGAEDGLSSIEIMFYNSVLSLPFLLFLIIATGEFPNSLSILFTKYGIDILLEFNSLVLTTVSRQTRKDKCFIIILGYSSSFPGDEHSSELHHVLVHNCQLRFNYYHSRRPQGSWLHDPRLCVTGGVQVHALNVTGLVINTAGGVWYSLAKYQQKKRNKLPKLMTDVDGHKNEIDHTLKKVVLLLQVPHEISHFLYL